MQYFLFFFLQSRVYILCHLFFIKSRVNIVSADSKLDAIVYLHYVGEWDVWCYSGDEEWAGPASQLCHT